MEKMKRFDEERKKLKVDDYSRVGYTMMTVIFIFCGSIIFFVPYPELNWKEDDIFYVYEMLFLALGISCYMNPYTRIGDFQNKEKIYDLLRYTPITRKELRKSRLKIMLRFVFWLTLVFMGIQILMTVFIERRIGVETFLYPIISGIILAGIGAVDVFRSTCC